MLNKNVTGNIAYTVNPLFDQPQLATYNLIGQNPGFTGNWASISSIADGTTFWYGNIIPVRYARLRGAGLTAAGFQAFIWTTETMQGT